MAAFNTSDQCIRTTLFYQNRYVITFICSAHTLFHNNHRSCLRFFNRLCRSYVLNWIEPAHSIKIMRHSGADRNDAAHGVFLIIKKVVIFLTTNCDRVQLYTIVPTSPTTIMFHTSYPPPAPQNIAIHPHFLDILTDLFHDEA